MDVQNSFTVTERTKFPTKPILGYTPHLKYIAALSWKTLKIRNLHFSCTYRTCFKCNLLLSVQHIKNAKWHENKCKD